MRIRNLLDLKANVDFILELFSRKSGSRAIWILQSAKGGKRDDFTPTDYEDLRKLDTELVSYIAKEKREMTLPINQLTSIPRAEESQMKFLDEYPGVKAQLSSLEPSPDDEKQLSTDWQKDLQKLIQDAMNALKVPDAMKDLTFVSNYPGVLHHVHASYDPDSYEMAMKKIFLQMEMCKGFDVVVMHGPPDNAGTKFGKVGEMAQFVQNNTQVAFVGHFHPDQDWPDATYESSGASYVSIGDTRFYRTAMKKRPPPEREDSEGTFTRPIPIVEVPVTGALLVRIKFCCCDLFDQRKKNVSS